jgi:hypothetical protein
MEKQLSEQQLIENYNKANKALEEAGDALEAHFEKVVDEFLGGNPTWGTIQDCKKRLQPMPVSAEKALLFRKLLLLEKSLDK